MARLNAGTAVRRSDKWGGMPTFAIDPVSVSGKSVPVAETTTVLVIGAGAAGCTAAIEGAQRGLQVVLVDENPIDFETMGNDVPLHFGGRMSGAARNRGAMTGAVVEANPLIAEAFEAGVDVRLSTSCWGLYLPAPGAQWPGRPVAGLADRDRCWQIGFEYVIVATGCRDLGIAFPGWESPGVMGARALQRLADSYGALDVARAVVLGSGPEALSTIRALGRAGAECAAIIECADELVAPADEVARVTGESVHLLTGHVIARAEADLDGVNAVVVTAIDAAGRHEPGTERTIECDTIVLSVAPVPCIELLEACGCRTRYDSARGGHVPVLDGEQRSSLPKVFVVGDVAGVWPAKSSDQSIGRSEARAAADSIAAALGAEGESWSSRGGCAAPDPIVDLNSYLRRWVTASVLEANGSSFVCQCEEVTARDILDVRPPRYLAREQATQKPSGLTAMLGNGPPSPDQVKRLTRAGMGTCQGRRCREQVAVLLALESGLALGDVPLATYRAPVRPLTLAQLAETDEDPMMTLHWDRWFGIPAQFVPPWELKPDDHDGPGDAER
jgi:thioredoxin reductase